MDKSQNNDVGTYGLHRRMAVRQEGAMHKDIHLQKQIQVFMSQLETVNLTENTH